MYDFINLEECPLMVCCDVIAKLSAEPLRRQVRGPWRTLEKPGVLFEVLQEPIRDSM